MRLTASTYSGSVETPRELTISYAIASASTAFPSTYAIMLSVFFFRASSVYDPAEVTAPDAASSAYFSAIERLSARLAAISEEILLNFSSIIFRSSALSSGIYSSREYDDIMSSTSLTISSFVLSFQYAISCSAIAFALSLTYPLNSLSAFRISATLSAIFSSALSTAVSVSRGSLIVAKGWLWRAAADSSTFCASSEWPGLVRHMKTNVESVSTTVIVKSITLAFLLIMDPLFQNISTAERDLSRKLIH